jgi:hypothetical protein
MLYELRIYETMPGKLPALNDRFAKHTCGLFAKHGVDMLAFWTEEIGTSNRLTYINVFPDVAARESRVAAFGADPEWQRVKAETEVDGPLVDVIHNTFMGLTPYSPQPRITTNVQELRIYEAMPGKMDALHQRFADHTMALFEKHGMENVGYWTDQVGTNNRLVYILGHHDLGSREKSFAAFQGDPEWTKARAASEIDGPLVRRSHSTILRPTDYSPAP